MSFRSSPSETISASEFEDEQVHHPFKNLEMMKTHALLNAASLSNKFETIKETNCAYNDGAFHELGDSSSPSPEIPISDLKCFASQHIQNEPKPLEYEGLSMDCQAENFASGCIKQQDTNESGGYNPNSGNLSGRSNQNIENYDYGFERVLNHGKLNESLSKNEKNRRETIFQELPANNVNSLSCVDQTVGAYHKIKLSDEKDNPYYSADNLFDFQTGKNSIETKLEERKNFIFPNCGLDSPKPPKVYDDETEYFESRSLFPGQTSQSEHFCAFDVKEVAVSDSGGVFFDPKQVHDDDNRVSAEDSSFEILPSPETKLDFNYSGEIMNDMRGKCSGMEKDNLNDHVMSENAIEFGTASPSLLDCLKSKDTVNVCGSYETELHKIESNSSGPSVQMSGLKRAIVCRDRDDAPKVMASDNGFFRNELNAEKAPESTNATEMVIRERDRSGDLFDFVKNSVPVPKPKITHRFCSSEVTANSYSDKKDSSTCSVKSIGCIPFDFDIEDAGKKDENKKSKKILKSGVSRCQKRFIAPWKSGNDPYREDTTEKAREKDSPLKEPQHFSQSKECLTNTSESLEVIEDTCDVSVDPHVLPCESGLSDKYLIENSFQVKNTNSCSENSFTKTDGNQSDRDFEAVQKNKPDCSEKSSQINLKNNASNLLLEKNDSLNIYSRSKELVQCKTSDQNAPECLTVISFQNQHLPVSKSFDGENEYVSGFNETNINNPIYEFCENLTSKNVDGLGKGLPGILELPKTSEDNAFYSSKREVNIKSSKSQVLNNNNVSTEEEGVLISCGGVGKTVYCDRETTPNPKRDRMERTESNQGQQLLSDPNIISHQSKATDSERKDLSSELNDSASMQTNNESSPSKSPKRSCPVENDVDVRLKRSRRCNLLTLDSQSSTSSESPRTTPRRYRSSKTEKCEFDCCSTTEKSEGKDSLCGGLFEDSNCHAVRGKAMSLKRGKQLNKENDSLIEQLLIDKISTKFSSIEKIIATENRKLSVDSKTVSRAFWMLEQLKPVLAKIDILFESRKTGTNSRFLLTKKQFLERRYGDLCAKMTKLHQKQGNDSIFTHALNSLKGPCRVTNDSQMAFPSFGRNLKETFGQSKFAETSIYKQRQQKIEDIDVWNEKVMRKTGLMLNDNEIDNDLTRSNNNYQQKNNPCSESNHFNFKYTRYTASQNLAFCGLKDSENKLSFDGKHYGKNTLKTKVFIGEIDCENASLILENHVGKNADEKKDQINKEANDITEINIKECMRSKHVNCDETFVESTRGNSPQKPKSNQVFLKNFNIKSSTGDNHAIKPVVTSIRGKEILEKKLTKEITSSRDEATVDETDIVISEISQKAIEKYEENKNYQASKMVAESRENPKTFDLRGSPKDLASQSLLQPTFLVNLKTASASLSRKRSSNVINIENFKPTPKPPKSSENAELCSIPQVKVSSSNSYTSETRPIAEPSMPLQETNKDVLSNALSGHPSGVVKNKSASKKLNKPDLWGLVNCGLLKPDFRGLTVHTAQRLVFASVHETGHIISEAGKSYSTLLHWCTSIPNFFQAGQKPTKAECYNRVYYQGRCLSFYKDSCDSLIAQKDSAMANRNCGDAKVCSRAPPGGGLLPIVLNLSKMKLLLIGDNEVGNTTTEIDQWADVDKWDA